MVGEAVVVVEEDSVKGLEDLRPCGRSLVRLANGLVDEEDSEGESW